MTTSTPSTSAEAGGADGTGARGHGAPAVALGEVARATVSSRSLVERALRAYDDTEPLIHAFAWLDRERALAQADERDARPRQGVLHGVPIAVKDIFDTRGIPTERGSRLFAGRIPTRSAEVVRRLEVGGAIVLGKTVTTEFAYYEPGPTRNPWRLSRTPGGSSQGSAAAVAAGVVAGAIGSQTNGSTIRPAAFCGVVGFKPTKGLLPTRGAMTFSRTLDHVGLFARTVGDVAILGAGVGLEVRPGRGPRAPGRLIGLRTSDWALAEPAMRERLEAVAALAEHAGVRVEWLHLPELDRAVELVGALMAYESARAVGREALRQPTLVGRQALALFQRGLAIQPAAYEAVKAERRRMVAAFDRRIGPADAILTLAAAGEAPALESTGDPRFCSRWTLLGAPAVALPAGLGPTGLPLGIQLVGARRGDQELLSIAAWLEGVIRDSGTR